MEPSLSVFNNDQILGMLARYCHLSVWYDDSWSPIRSSVMRLLNHALSEVLATQHLGNDFYELSPQLTSTTTTLGISITQDAFRKSTLIIALAASCEVAMHAP
jgi:hypothetical protein